ncbi:MAG: hypothetical protein JZU50_11955 [Desulfobulbaceae bacterium]|nr:hypothetical protein [Desulfobulbaceae bacterium]
MNWAEKGKAGNEKREDTRLRVVNEAGQVQIIIYYVLVDRQLEKGANR